MNASGHPHPAFASAAAAIVTAGRRKDQLEPADILAVALEAGDEAAGNLRWRPSSDIALHRAACAARPAVAAALRRRP
jgi:ribulose-5-phosphate 4-epimerase/fuculose-1-phosphate aldolase